MNTEVGLSRLFDALGLTSRDRTQLCKDRDDLDRLPVSGATHVMRRAWADDQLGLDAIYLVDGKPVIYFKTDRGEDGRAKVFRRFWNHGVSPLLMLVDKTDVRVYSSLSPPVQRGESPDSQDRLVDIFHRTSDGLLALRRFVQAVESGQVYRHDTYRKSFKPESAIDRHLMRNLKAARAELASVKHRLDLNIIHRLLIRMIFMRYMEQRGVLNGDFFTHLGAGSDASLQEVLEEECSTDQLYRVFLRLRDKFKGSLFEKSELEAEREDVEDAHVETLFRMFFGQEDPQSGQQLLFDLYDFSIIPIGTISAIYEEFLHAEDPEKGKDTGTYYTPTRLVEFTLDVATRRSDESDSKFDWSDTTKRILDPACGSGAFLVAAFNRFAEAWRRNNPRAWNRTKLRGLSRILEEQITGVDISNTACQITCFSLYLAMLDFLDPRDIKVLTSAKYSGLPNLLRKGENHRGDAPLTVIEGDFLAAKLCIKWNAFDLVVGNPPWVSRKGGEDLSLQDWKKRNRRLPIPADQIACAFLWHVDRFMTSDGSAVMLVPSGVFVGDKTNGFQSAWFTQRTVDQIVQLVDLRFILFPDADHWCTAVGFRKSRPKPSASVEYIAPKAAPAELNGDRITVLPEDRKEIQVQDVVSSARDDDAPLLWFRNQWASPRDDRFLDRLLALPRLSTHAGEATESKRWIKGQGLQPSGVGPASKATYEPFWSDDAVYLDARADFSMVLRHEDCIDVPPMFQRKLHRARNPRLFEAPLVVFNQGFSKFAYASFDVLFRHSLQAISGPAEDDALLMFLTAALASPLAQYFALHCTGKHWYRDKSLLEDMLRFPFPLPADAPGRHAQDNIRDVASIMRSLSEGARGDALRDTVAVERAKQETQEIVYAYYDIAPNERILIEDTLSVIAKSSTPNQNSIIPTIQPPTREDLNAYATTFIDTFDQWARRSGIKLSARCIPSYKAGVCVMAFTKHRRQTAKRFVIEEAETALDDALVRLSELLPDSYGSLEMLRHVKVFDADDLYLVRPMMRRSWLRSAALNDADDIAEAILERDRRLAG